jgi:PKD repeat protein
MKTYILKSGLYSLLMLLALVSCKKEEPTLKGSASEAAFTAISRHVPGGDTLPFVTYVTFNNTSKDAFSYFWDFGDRTTSVQKSPTHLYGAASNYNVTLRSVGSGGSNTSSLTISVSGPCTNPMFSSLTGCASRSWALSPVSDAISVLSPNGSQVIFNAAPVACQGDDIYTFFADGKLNYNAKLKTYESNSANNTGNCVSNLQPLQRSIM